MRQFIVPVDGSSLAWNAVDVAVALARQCNGDVDVVPHPTLLRVIECDALHATADTENEQYLASMCDPLTPIEPKHSHGLDGEDRDRPLVACASAPVGCWTPVVRRSQ